MLVTASTCGTHTRGTGRRWGGGPGGQLQAAQHPARQGQGWAGGLRDPSLHTGRVARRTPLAHGQMCPCCWVASLREPLQRSQPCVCVPCPPRAAGARDRWERGAGFHLPPPLSRSPALGHGEVSGRAAGGPTPPCAPHQIPQPLTLALSPPQLPAARWDPRTSCSPRAPGWPVAVAVVPHPWRWLRWVGTEVALAGMARGTLQFSSIPEYLQTQQLCGGEPQGAPRVSATGRSLRCSHSPWQRAGSGADTMAGDPELRDGGHNRTI